MTYAPTIFLALSQETSKCERCQAPVIFLPESTQSEPLAIDPSTGDTHRAGYGESCRTAHERAERTVSEAQSLLRDAYWNDVRDCAGSIDAETHDQFRDGVRGEQLREWLLNHIHETIDSHRRVTFTTQAQECLLYSENDGRHFEEFGADGAVKDGAVNWGALAFAAFEGDVLAQLDAEGLDVNDPEASYEGLDDEDHDDGLDQVDANKGEVRS